MPLTEAQTRQKLIDEKLGFAGWDVNDPSQVIQELDIDLVEAGVQVSRYAAGFPSFDSSNLS